MLLGPLIVNFTMYNVVGSLIFFNFFRLYTDYCYAFKKKKKLFSENIEITIKLDVSLFFWLSETAVWNRSWFNNVIRVLRFCVAV